MKNPFRTTIVLILIFMATTMEAQNKEQGPVRIAIARMTHDHIGFILNREKKTDLQVVGIYEPDRQLAEHHAKSRYNTSLIYDNLERMLDEVKPEAVVAFG
jgi:predicted dehydrogenase